MKTDCRGLTKTQALFLLDMLKNSNASAEEINRTISWIANPEAMMAWERVRK